MGVNTAMAMESFMREHSASKFALTALVEDDAEDTRDAESQASWEIEQVCQTQNEGDEIEYLVRWKGWGADDDTWEPPEHLMGSAETIAAWHAQHGGTLPTCLAEAAGEAGAKAASRKRSRATSSYQQLAYEVSKLLCYQTGKAMREDQHGEKFRTWLNNRVDKTPADRKYQLLHQRMKPIVGNRYFVYHFNATIIFLMTDVYQEYLEEVRQHKKKDRSSLNRLESSVQRGLNDEKTIAQARAAAILNHQIEQPILWAAKKFKSLELNPFHALVLQKLEHWSTEEGVEELLQLPGTLSRHVDPEGKEESSDWMVKAVAAAHSTDAEVRLLLMGCCAAGAIKREQHAAGHLEGKEARPVTDGMEKRGGMAEGSNDTSESNIALSRFIDMTMKRLRISGREALMLGKRNKPTMALKAGSIGNPAAVIKLMMKLAREEYEALGTESTEQLKISRDIELYRAVDAPSISDAAQKARATKEANVAAAKELAADYIDCLILSDKVLMKLSDGRARLLIAAWKLVPTMTFENGSAFDAKCLFRSEGRGAKGAMLKLDIG